jgi:hypothetical protein
MTADRAALVEKVAAEIRKYDLTSDEIAAFAIDLIRAEVLEEAARVCESELVGSFDQYSQGYNDGCEESAAAIRALKGGTNQPKEDSA